jgi:chromosomal replication initiator protein
MGKAVAAATVGSRSLAESVRRAFHERIGEERFAVWFGDSLWEDAGDGRTSIVIRAGHGVTHEWLRRTFRGEVEKAIGQLGIRGVGVAWEPAAAPGPKGAANVRGELAVVRPPEIAPAGPAGQPRRPVRGLQRLDDFVAGPSNRMALAAIEMAASRPGEMSPTVIHGPSGVGKTHLLEGCCGRFRERDPSATAVFLAAEQFTTGFLQALHGSGLPGFRRTCRSADLLVIDDLQFFVGKRATIQELQQTIEVIQRQGGQVVLGCDREPDALTELGPELLTRLRGGIVVRLEPGDYDVRRGIVAAVCRDRGLAVPDEVADYVATHMTRHARELQGAVNRLEATSLMLGVPISLGLAEEALVDLVRASGRSVRLAEIEQAVCTAFGLARGSLQSSGRARAASHARMLAMFLARKHTHAALSEISSFFGRRSHSTVIAAQKTVSQWLAEGARIVLAETAWDAEEAIRRVEDMLRAG